MGESSIPVDVLNPGQVFACLGLVEASIVLCGRTRAGFDWRDPTAVRFNLEAAGERPPVDVVLAFLAAATVRTRAPRGSALTTNKWDIDTEPDVGSNEFPFDVQSSPATLPAVLIGPAAAGVEARIEITHWADKTRSDSVKFWGGSGGMPGARLAYDSLEAVKDRITASAADPFSVAAPQSNSFRLDWRRDYIPIDAGFSLNKHGDFTSVGYPLVEVLAAIGLTYARPHKTPRTKLEYHYAIIGTDSRICESWLLDPILLRAALGGAEVPFPRRRFCMHLGWPGKEGQSRAITTVTEESV